MDQPRQDNYGRSSPFAPHFAPMPPDPQAYTDVPLKPPPAYWEYGRGGSITQPYNNVQDYNTGHPFTGEQKELAQLEQEAQRQRNFAPTPAMLNEYQMILGHGHAGSMPEALQQMQTQEQTAPHGDIVVTDVDQNLPVVGGVQGEAGGRSGFENEGQVMMNNYHYRKHLQPTADGGGQMPGLPAEQAPGEPLAAPLELGPPQNMNQWRPPLPPPAGVPQIEERKQSRCFALGHKQRSPAERAQQALGDQPQERDIYQDMKQFDAELRRNKWKNKDHFHLVQVKDVYTTAAAKLEQGAAGPGEPPGALTATVYSQDSEAKQEVKTNKQRYAQILVEQMKQKKERRLKEKAERASMAVDLDFNAGARVVVPDIPNLIHQKDGRVVQRAQGPSPQRELRQRFRTLSPAEKEKIQQANYGFFENLYGPEQEMRKMYSRARRVEMDEHLHGQMLQNQARKMDERFANRYSGLVTDKAMNAAKASQYSNPNQFMSNQMAQYGPPQGTDNQQGFLQPWGQPVPPPNHPAAQLQGPQYPQANPFYQQQPPGYPQQQYQPYPPGTPGPEPMASSHFINNAVGAAPPSGQHSPNAFMKQQENLLQVPPQPEQFGQPPGLQLNLPGQPAPSDNLPQTMSASITNTPPKQAVDLSGIGAGNSRKRGTRRHLHENSMTLSHDPNGGRAPFSPFRVNPAFPQADPAVALQEKEKYKYELRLQMQEKKEREAKEKLRKQEEDMKEEMRLKREREELLRQYQENGSERQRKNEGEGATGRGAAEGDWGQKNQVQPLGEIAEQTPFQRQLSDPLKEKTQMDTNMIADMIDARQLALNRAANRPNQRGEDGRIQPPSKQDVEFQAAIEQNMQVFANSIAQMRKNHANLMRQYNTEILKMQQQVGQTEKETVEAQTNALSAQIQSIQDEMDRIVTVVEQTGESIIGNQGARSGPEYGGEPLPTTPGVSARQGPERQPMIRLSAEQMSRASQDPSHPSDAQKKKRIMVNLDSKPTSSVKSKYRARPPTQQKPYLKPRGPAQEENVKIVQRQPGDFGPEAAAPLGFKDHALLSAIQMQIDAENEMKAAEEGAPEVQIINTGRDSTGALLARRNSAGQLPPLQHQVSIRSRRSTRSGGAGPAQEVTDQVAGALPADVQMIAPGEPGPALATQSSLKRQQTLPALALAPRPAALEQDPVLLEKQLLSQRDPQLPPNSQLGATITGQDLEGAGAARLSQRSRRSVKQLPPLAPTSAANLNVDLEGVQSQVANVPAVDEQARAAEAEDAAINLDKQSHSNFDTQAPAQEVIYQQQILESVRQQEQAEAAKAQQELPSTPSILVPAQLPTTGYPLEPVLQGQDVVQLVPEANINSHFSNLVDPTAGQAVAPPPEPPKNEQIIEEPLQNWAYEMVPSAIQQQPEQPTAPVVQIEAKQPEPVIEAAQAQPEVVASAQVVAPEPAPAQAVEANQMPTAGPVPNLFATPEPAPAQTPQLPAPALAQQTDFAATMHQVRPEPQPQLGLVDRNVNVVQQRIAGTLAEPYPGLVASQVPAQPVPVPPPLQPEQETGPRLVVASNQVDQGLFDQRLSIRDAVKETAKIEAAHIKSEQDMYSAPMKRLYADPDLGHRRVDPIQAVPERSQPAPGLDSTINPHLYKSADFTLNPSQAQQLLDHATGTAGNPDAEVEPVAVADLFTNDSKINDKNIIRQFQVEQKQMQDAAYRKQGRAFGCYGPIEEETELARSSQAAPTSTLPLSDVEERFLRQKPLKYSKNDPFGVNMRLRQSLSSTNQILFRQDNQRYIESMATTFGPQIQPLAQVYPGGAMMYPSSSRDKLNQLNTKAREMLTNQDLHYDPELFRDESEEPRMQIGVGASQMEDLGGQPPQALDPAHMEGMKVGDIPAMPLPTSLKTAHFQQEVIQSLSGVNSTQQSRSDAGVRLPASGYQPNFNFGDSAEQLPAQQQQNQFLAFQMRNSDLFQPTQDVLFIDQQNQMLFNGGQVPTGAALDPNLDQIYDNQANGLALYRDVSAPGSAQQFAQSSVDSSLSQQQQQKISSMYGNSGPHPLEKIQEQPEEAEAQQETRVVADPALTAQRAANQGLQDAGILPGAQAQVAPTTGPDMTAYALDATAHPQEGTVSGQEATQTATMDIVEPAQDAGVPGQPAPAQATAADGTFAANIAQTAPHGQHLVPEQPPTTELQLGLQPSLPTQQPPTANGQAELVVLPSNAPLDNQGASYPDSLGRLSQDDLMYIQQLTTKQMQLQQDDGNAAIQIVQSEIDEPLKLKNDIFQEANAKAAMMDEELVPEIEVQDKHGNVDVQQLAPERLVGEDDNYEYYYVYEEETPAANDGRVPGGEQG